MRFRLNAFRDDDDYVVDHDGDEDAIGDDDDDDGDDDEVLFFGNKGIRLNYRAQNEANYLDETACVNSASNSKENLPHQWDTRHNLSRVCCFADRIFCLFC